MLAVVDVVMSTAWWAVMITGITVGMTRAAGRKAPGGVSRMFFELRWTYPFTCVWIHFIYPTIQDSGPILDWIYYMCLFFDAVNWYFFSRHKDDDDRWKRRMREAKSRIVATAAGLSVVPATAGPR